MRTFRKIFFIVFIGALAVALFTFAQQNSASFELTFAVWKAPEMPVSYLLLIFAFFGFIVALLLGMIEFVRLKARLRRANKKVQLLEKEVDTLRNQTLYEEPSLSRKEEDFISAEPRRNRTLEEGSDS